MRLRAIALALRVGLAFAALMDRRYSEMVEFRHDSNARALPKLTHVQDHDGIPLEGGGHIP